MLVIYIFVGEKALINFFKEEKMCLRATNHLVLSHFLSVLFSSHGVCM